MEQDDAVPDTAAGLPRLVLRLVLLLGGSVALWWALATGAAHADDHGSAPDLLGAAGADATHAVTGVSVEVRHTARTATQEVRHNTSQTGTAVRASGHSAPSPVRAVAQPVADTVGATLEQTSDTAGKAEAALDGAVADVVGTVDQQLTRTTERLGVGARTAPAWPTDPASPTDPATRAPHRHRSAPVTSGSVRELAAPRLFVPRLGTGVPGPVSAAAPAAGFVPSAAAADPMVDPSTPGALPGPTPPDPAVPTSSVVSSPSLVAVLGALVLGASLLLQRRPRAHAFALAPAPALLPGCSPD
jgi:hypothetical protein